MKDIKDMRTLDDFLKTSNLHFVSSGILKVSDPLFLTRWIIDEKGFRSSTKYPLLPDEGFYLTIADDQIPDTWNHFGIAQNLKQEGYMSAPYHRNKHIEIHYVIKGEFKLKVNQRIVTLKENDVCIINPHCYHSDIVQDKELELYIVGVNEEYLPKSLVNNQDYPFIYNSFRKDKHYSEYLIIRDVEDLMPLIKEMDSTIKTPELKCNLIASIKTIFSKNPEYIQETETSRNTMLFEEIRVFINENYASVKLEDLEFYFNFSKDHISRIIKEESGLSFSKFTQEVRINKTKKLLLETDLTIKEIMRQVGYKNETYFYRIFKEETELSPHEYRINKQ